MRSYVVFARVALGLAVLSLIPLSSGLWLWRHPGDGGGLAFDASTPGSRTINRLSAVFLIAVGLVVLVGAITRA